jgi:hypothetical protein
VLRTLRSGFGTTLKVSPVQQLRQLSGVNLQTFWEIDGGRTDEAVINRPPGVDPQGLTQLGAP